MKFLIFNIFMFVLCIHVYGQRTCGSELNIAEIQQTDTARYLRIMALENQMQTHLDSATFRGMSQATIIIPVVVHVVYNTSAQNISDAQINSQLQVLNEDFRRLNTDRTNTPAVFANIAGDANIEFKLAKIDPNGNPTTGITRTSTTQTKFYAGNDGVKFSSTGGQNAWDANKYLNIWVCNIWRTSSQDLLGYAQFPSEFGMSPNTDGVVIHSNCFGRNGSTVAPYNKGRTATHEVGHWLNLRHIWGDDGDFGCHCNGSDGVDDTPNQSVMKYDCPSFPTTDCCTPSSPGIMFMNYMDYTDDACMNLFTEGQVVRMRAIFDAETGVRKEMLATAEYLTEECPQTIIINRTYPNSFENVFGIRKFVITGCTINITNTTINANTTVHINSQNGVTIGPDFWAKQGSNVTITAAQASPSLLSAKVVDDPEIATSLEEAVTTQNPSEKFDFTVYPNPNDGNFTVEITGEVQPYTVEIYNASGGMLGKTSCDAEAVNINRSDLPQGIYYVRLLMGKEVATKKVVIK
ncbi:M43 family zinc metalloprotease [Viscerimonas tarda]